METSTKKNKRHFRGLPRVDVQKDMSTKFPTRHLLHLFSWQISASYLELEMHHPWNFQWKSVKAFLRNRGKKRKIEKKPKTSIETEDLNSNNKKTRYDLVATNEDVSIWFRSFPTLITKNYPKFLLSFYKILI